MLTAMAEMSCKWRTCSLMEQSNCPKLSAAEARRPRPHPRQGAIYRIDLSVPWADQLIFRRDRHQGRWLPLGCIRSNVHTT